MISGLLQSVIDTLFACSIDRTDICMRTEVYLIPSSLSDLSRVAETGRHGFSYHLPARFDMFLDNSKYRDCKMVEVSYHVSIER